MKKSTVADSRMERRKQKRLAELGTPNPVCVICGMDRWTSLELHHLGGRKHGDELVTVCRNCHAELSEYQKDHPPLKGKPSPTQSTGYQLLGGADLFDMLAKSCRARGLKLIEPEMEKTS